MKTLSSLSRSMTAYSTLAVKKMLEYVLAEPVTIMDVANLTRYGGLLYPARVGRGWYDKYHTRTVMIAILRRRLAKQLGRKSARLLSVANSYHCPDCGGIAVVWEGKWLCENKHTGQYIA